MIQIVYNGIDLVVKDSVQLPDLSYGLVTAHHARTLEGVSSRAVLQNKVKLQKLFSPEHGLSGLADAGERVASSKDPLTGLPICSLYQDHPGASLEEVGDEHDDIQGIIYDLPDVGTRFYTYIATCLEMVDFCAKNGKSFIVLDRPNPLGGEIFEGLVLDKEDYSFVGPYALPIRYGLTIGELVSLYVKEKEIELDLTIVEMSGWKRSMFFSDTHQVFTIPSPNIPTWQTALLYPGTCLIEGTNMSEGRGTPRPFSWFGAPYIDEEELCDALGRIPHSGLELRPQSYKPYASKNAGRPCPGIAIEITDERSVRPVIFMIKAIGIIRDLYPNSFKFLDPGQNALAFIDRLLGHNFAQERNLDSTYFERQESKHIGQFKERISRIKRYD